MKNEVALVASIGTNLLTIIIVGWNVPILPFALYCGFTYVVWRHILGRRS